MNSEKKWVVFFATGCGAGFSPVAPGTFGSVAALPLCFLISGVSALTGGIMVVVLIAFAIGISGEMEKIAGRKDPGCIVIDEMVGMMVMLYGIPFGLPTVLWGFVLFRFLDITKPCPIGWVEKRLSGGAGVVLDDVVAGLLGNLMLRAALLVL
jgi:phosphatidylglycerophosphatase A